VLGVVAAAAAVIVGIGLVAGGVVELAQGSRGIERSHECAAGETGRCFVRVPGVVSAASASAIHVSTDEGSVEIVQRGSEFPAAGARVLVERWDGTVVAVVDRETERRYKAIEWPMRFDPLDFLLCGIGIALLALPTWLVVRRLRS